MILGHYVFEKPIVFYEGKIQSLVVENPNQFTEFLTEIMNQMEGFEGRFILTDDEKELPLYKGVDLIFNPFTLDPNSKKAVKSLYDSIVETAFDGALAFKTDRTFSLIREYLNEVFSLQEIDVECRKTIDMMGLLKAGDVGFRTEFDGILDRVISYVSTSMAYVNPDLFIFINLRAFLSEDQIHIFHDFLLYEKISALFIENKDFRKREIDTVKIIDKDLCEINKV